VTDKESGWNWIFEIIIREPRSATKILSSFLNKIADQKEKQEAQ
jgi:hypothetical protein